MDSIKGKGVLENIEEPIDDLEDEFDSGEEKDEDETMLDNDAPMPVFTDMKSYVTCPFEEITDEFME